MNPAEARIGYAFKDKALLAQALTHPSYGSDHHEAHYQRLEFLGDAVLELYVSEELYRAFPSLPEGKLTRMRADLVCERSLSQAFKELGLSPFIRLSVGEEKSGGRDKPSIQCDVLEAVIGAVYLDGGSKEAGAFIERALGEVIRLSAPGSDHLDSKSRLQSVLQAEGDMPIYELIASDGPAHAPVFSYAVKSAAGKVLGTGSGHSKQAAQLEAAAQALDRIGGKAGA